MRIIPAFLFSTFCICCAISAGIIEVPKDAETIQLGIDMASDNDTILVEPGLYVENVDFLGKAVVVYAWGGPNETQFMPADPNLPAVSFVNGEGLAAEFTGFRIIGGGYSHTVFIDSGASPTVHHNIFHNNIPDTVFDMAVIAVWGDSCNPTIARNILYDNRGISCVWVQKGKANIFNNTFDGNRAAVMCNTGLASVRNNIIGNSVGIAIQGVFAELDYNNLWFNSSDYG